MSFQEKIKQRVQEKIANQDLAENDNLLETGGELEAFEHSTFFGIENAKSYTSCLDLRFSDGKFKAMPYSYILEIDFDATEGIEIFTTAKKIVITGRNLRLLYNYLSAFRVRYIQANVGNDLTEEKSLFVKEIKIEEL